MTTIRYVEHPAIAHRRAMVANLPRTTGRSLPEWLAVVAASGRAERKARTAWLKEEHGLGGGTAGLIAELAEGGSDRDGADPEAQVEALFSGARAGLRPVADRLLAGAAALGDDVSATPCATMLPIRRAHVIAQLKPTTRTRLDLGLALGDVPLAGRLEDSGGLARKDRITRRIALRSVADVDDEVLGWLHRAYELDG
ncbi:MAG: DUF5655 domain-containing protein [Gemmatimonadaceae bacterium]